MKKYELFINKSILFCIIMFCITFFIKEDLGNIFIRIAFLLELIQLIREKQKKEFNWNYFKRYINPILFFILGIFLMVTLDMFKYESISMFESIIKMIIPFVVILIKRPSLKELYLIVGVLIIGLFINNIYAIYNYMFINSSSRAMGISEGVLYLAGLLLLQFPFYLCILMDKKIINNKLKYILGVILLVVLISIYINSSRMTWCLIAFDMLVFILLVVQTWKKKILLFMVILLSLSFIYNYNEHVYHKINDAFDMESTSTKGHYYYARDGLNLFYDNKLLGVGLNNFKESMVKGNYVSIEAENNLKKDLHNKIGDKYVMPHAHNDIIMFLSEMGVLGGAIYIIFNITLVKVLFNDWIKYKNYISLAMLMVTINIILRGITDYNFALMGVVSVYFFILSVYICYIYRKYVYNESIIDKVSYKYLLSIYGFIISVILLRILSKHIF